MEKVAWKWIHLLKKAFWRGERSHCWLKVKSCAIYGLESFLVDVEVDISSGLPAFDKVG